MIQAGIALINQAPNAIGKGKAIIALFFLRPFWIIFAAFSGCIKNGILKTLTSVNGVLINPGQTTLTFTFSDFNQPRRASPHALTQDLLAEYAGADGKPLYPAIELIIAICPDFRLRIRSNKGKTVFATPKK